VGLRVLITNGSVATRSGSELYVWDLATELLKRGHSPVVYSPVLGALAARLRAATIPVVDDLSNVSSAPDIIHGHHNLETLTALLHFPRVPAIRLGHGWNDERPQLFPRILRFVPVDHTVRERMVGEWGVPEARVQVVLNFVDLARFRPRGPLPARPLRALVFSNSASVHLPAVQRACASLGISVDAVGSSVGAVAEEPESLLGRYDVVFAKARCAMEAMAAGAAVVLCDQLGVGPLVTSANFDDLRQWNFGMRTLRDPLGPEPILRELRKYDAADATEVTRRIHATAGLDAAVDSLLEVYEDVIAEWRRSGPADLEAELRAAAAYLRSLDGALKAGGVRYHAEGLLQGVYLRCERSRWLRWFLPSRSFAKRLRALIRRR
jgi:hypothetical protein